MNEISSLRLIIPMPQMATVEVVDHLLVRVAWSAGMRAPRTDVIDLSPLINSLKFYRPLRENSELFRTAHLIEEGRILAWGDDSIDMAADSIEQLAEESMTADDFKDFLKSNNLTHGEAAALLGRSRRQIENYLSAAELIPRIVVLACFGLTARKQARSSVISGIVADSQTSASTVTFIEAAEPTARVVKTSLAKPTISKLPSGTTVEASAEAS